MERNLQDYNIEAIKSIYKEDLLESNLTNDNYIINNYLNNHIFFNAIQCPDKIIGKNSYHGFSLKRSNYSNEYDNTVTYAKISDNILNNYTLYKDNQIISYQDIDWDNAYLKYLDRNFIKSNQPFTYNIITFNQNTQEIEIVNENLVEPIEEYNTEIPLSQYIKTTQDLYKVIDYLLNRYLRLKKLMEIIKSQYEVMNKAHREEDD